MKHTPPASATNAASGGGIPVLAIEISELAQGVFPASTASPTPTFTSTGVFSSGKVAAVKRREGYATALDVARYLVYLAACDEEPDFLSHLRVQKLLYYVQGWSLALRNKAMFAERIEAWAHGPVVKELYPTFAAYGRRAILVDDIGLPDELTRDELAFIESVWASYKQFSASSLREMSHKETPWLDARQGLSPVDKCNREITKGAMQKFFSAIAK